MLSRMFSRVSMSWITCMRDGLMDDDPHCRPETWADLHLYILSEAACFDRRFPFSTACIHHPPFVEIRDKLPSCAFLKTSSARQESMDRPFIVRARPRQDGSLLKENQPLNF